MKLLPSGLFARLALVLLVLMALLGSALLLVSQRMSEFYSQAVLQQLNQPVADYITHQQPLLTPTGEVNNAALDELASRAMILNPALEIYLLDPGGRILGHRLPVDQVQRQQVGLAPIHQYLQTAARYPILGDDPGNPDQGNIFSVAPITDALSLQPLGYVYAVVGGQQYRQLQQSAFEQYVFSIAGLLILCCVLLAIAAGLLAFFAMTRRLSQLRQVMREYDLLHPQLSSLERLPRVPHQHSNEIDQLTAAFRDMAAHIHQQFTRLQSLDQSRRELIANVSHDLRTPLAAVQGYIETAMLKAEAGMSGPPLAEHLQVSIRQCQRLSHLIEALFELSRLQMDSTLPNPEPFSLLELAHDCVQDFQLKADRQQVSLRVEGRQQDSYVTADIAMIQRVLQNLIDNALRHTEAGGQIRLQIERLDQGTRIRVTDTGCGISQHDIPFIFERYFQARNQAPEPQASSSRRVGHGLGLAIVQRILELHQSRIEVESELHKGSCFSFVL
jgi:two-component system, OmpR family, sensor kinase